MKPFLGLGIKDKNSICFVFFQNMVVFHFWSPVYKRPIFNYWNKDQFLNSIENGYTYFKFFIGISV